MLEKDKNRKSQQSNRTYKKGPSENFRTKTNIVTEIKNWIGSTEEWRGQRKESVQLKIEH